MGNKTIQIGGVNEGVNLVLSYIEKNPGKRIPFIADVLRTSPKNIERWIKDLKKDGLIEYRGSSKKRGYFKI